MAQQKKAINPFYVLLVIAGVAFALSACAYGVMAVKMLHAANPAGAAGSTQKSDDSLNQDGNLMEFLDQHGTTLLLVEIAILAVCTFAAIATDGFWIRRAEQAGKE